MSIVPYPIEREIEEILQKIYYTNRTSSFRNKYFVDYTFIMFQYIVKYHNILKKSSNVKEINTINVLKESPSYDYKTVIEIQIFKNKAPKLLIYDKHKTIDRIIEPYILKIKYTKKSKYKISFGHIGYSFKQKDFNKLLSSIINKSYLKPYQKSLMDS